MRFLLILLFSTIVLPIGYAQTSIDDVEADRMSEVPVYVVVDNAPDFPGGHEALAQYIGENLQYPAEAEANSEQGRSIVQFVVNTDGSISQERIVRSSGSVLLDAEALRVVNSLPKWIPAKIAGKDVRSYYTLPITFKLDTIKPTDAEVSKDEEHADDSSLVVENMPEYPGGVQAMMQFLSDNIKYPKDAQEKAIEGRVICQFIVEKDGSIVEVTIASSSGNASLDKEAIRAVQSMPKWKPGLQKGEPVRVKFTVPINFHFGHNSKQSKQQEALASWIRTLATNPAYNEINQYIGSKINYPAYALEDRIQGTSTCQFTVKPDGSISDIHVKSSSGESALDNEVVRMVRKLPKKESYKLRGENDINYCLTVTFKIVDTDYSRREMQVRCSIYLSRTEEFEEAVKLLQNSESNYNINF